VTSSGRASLQWCHPRGEYGAHACLIAGAVTMMNSENESAFAFHADPIAGLIMFIAHTMTTFA
jgi:hypothetical protein